MSGKTLIVGHIGDNEIGRTCIALAHIKAQFSDAVVVNAEDLKKQDLEKVFEITSQPQFPIEPFVDGGYMFEKNRMSRRAARRKAERDAKKKFSSKKK